MPKALQQKGGLENYLSLPILHVAHISPHTLALTTDSWSVFVTPYLRTKPSEEQDKEAGSFLNLCYLRRPPRQSKVIAHH